MATNQQELKERGWEKVQIKAFTSWVNGLLSNRNRQISDIKSEMSDGVSLIHFLELLSGKKVSQRWNEKPPSRIQKIENLHIALQFVEKEMGVRITVSAEDFADENLKMILGFLWTLFKKYKIQTIKQDDKSSEEGLLLWCKKTTEGYKDVSIESFKHSFRNGLAFLALCDKYVENKDTLDFDKFDKDNAIDNLGSAFKLAEQHLGVPQLLDPQEVSEGNVDERSLVLYISLYFHAFVAKQQQKLVLEEKERIEAEMRGLQGSLEDRAKMAVQLQETNEKLRQQLEQLQKELDAERITSANLRDEVTRLREELEEERRKNAALQEKTVSLEGQVHDLEGQVSELTAKFGSESSERAAQTEKFNSQAKVQTSGLAVLKKNLEQHIDDLHRWQKYLDFDKSVEIDFTEARVELLQQISPENFDEQLRVLTDKLDKENTELHALLKTKEAEAKARKENDKKKKERQQKQTA